MQNSNEVTQRCPQIFHQPQNINSLRHAGYNTTNMVFEGELAVKLHSKDVEVGTSMDRTQTRPSHLWGGLTVLDLLMTKALVLLGLILTMNLVTNTAITRCK